MVHTETRNQSPSAPIRNQKRYLVEVTHAKSYQLLVGLVAFQDRKVDLYAAV